MEPNDPSRPSSRAAGTPRNGVTHLGAPLEASPVDVDRAFDDMRQRDSRLEQVRSFITPKLQTGRTYLEQHRLVSTLVGFGLGFFLGRLMRRR